jgi:HD-GYP domain-containing protein (c-di-GMP phosphodiesterase class II)
MMPQTILDTSMQNPALGTLVPVAYGRLPDDVLTGFPIYLRNVGASGEESFRLYAGDEVPFNAEHRQRLTELGVEFLHIPEQCQMALRRRLEDRIERVALDTGMELAARCEMVYETAIELIAEMQSLPQPVDAAPRLTRLARAIVTLHREDSRAFTYFYSAARHDDYSVTHVANAATWLPALAIALGETKNEQLAALCLGAMLYDVGMILLPRGILQNKGKFTAIERRQMQQHPETGAQILSQACLDPLISTMALQHQERLDGSGYPRGLTFDRIHAAARMAAVIDTFDSLTSFRPYRQREVTPQAALATLKRETPHHYDPKVVDAWAKLVVAACPEAQESAARERPAGPDASLGRRRFRRYAVKCQATLKRLALVGGIWMEKSTVSAVAHNLSRGGLGLLTRTALQPGEYYRAKLQGKEGMNKMLAIMIVRTRLRSDGWHEAGARFVDLEAEASPLPNGEFVTPESVQTPSA